MKEMDNTSAEVLFLHFPVNECGDNNVATNFNILFNIMFQESVDNLIKCVSQDLGFSEGKPVAAFTIYKCLLHWNSFEAEKTNVFDRLIQMIGSAIEVIFNIM